MTAKGNFEVKMEPLEGLIIASAGQNFGRFELHKTFTGDLHGKSHGEMLTAMTAVKGSAGYVAIEKFTGELAGKKGSFVLQHFGIMSKEAEKLLLEVVPDSGTGELSGISGKMIILRENGDHQYRFDYQL